MSDQTNQDTVRLGLAENAGQFALLVLVNGFVGALVGLERTVLPLLAEKEFGIASKTAILSFLITFGFVKAFANLSSGFFSERLSRKKILVIGWFFGIPVPLLIILAPSWEWIVAANVFLGINQGFCWSTTVVMKIDLVGQRNRGLAMGLNEFAGYIAVAFSAFLSGYLAARYGFRPAPFYPGLLFALLGLFLSAFYIKDTSTHVQIEAKAYQEEKKSGLKEIFALTSWKNKELFACSQAGMINNLNDGMIWGLFPLYAASFIADTQRVGALASLYPAVWGITQLFTGFLSDRVGRKWMIATGMWAQAVAIILLGLSSETSVWIVSLILLGIGTAQVYPALLAAVSDRSHPSWRASSVGVYRFWRDAGYAIGALLSGLLADIFNVRASILFTGALTFFSGVVAAFYLKENRSAMSALRRSKESN
jgi:MFS family permease